MNYFLIKKYIEKLTKQNIIDYSKKEQIILTNDEINILYYYIKNKWEDFLKGNQQEILKELKYKVTPPTYKKIEKLYHQYKNKI